MIASHRIPETAATLMSGVLWRTPMKMSTTIEALTAAIPRAAAVFRTPRSCLATGTVRTVQTRSARNTPTRTGMGVMGACSDPDDMVTLASRTGQVIADQVQQREQE